MKKTSNIVDVSTSYNAGCYDVLTGLRIWEAEIEQGAWLRQNAELVGLESSETDTNYMATLYARYLLTDEKRAAYKFMFETKLC